MHGSASTYITQREIAVLWSDIESDVVEGRYPLDKLVRSEGRCGWFETKFNDKPAIISLFESLNDEPTLLERLRAVEKVSDKNVAAIYEAGATKVRDTPLVYAVMEYTEENLEDVLRGRALSADETKEVADGLLKALKAIHKERLICGRLEAASVLAAGDTIKLRSDYLQLVPKDTAFEPNAAKDVRDLGSLLHQCLTQKPLKRATDANDPSLQLLPAPFVLIVRRTLSGQATVDEIATILRTGAAPAPAPMSAPAAVSAPVPTSGPASPPAQPKAVPTPVPKAEPVKTAVRSDEIMKKLLPEIEEPSPKRTGLIVGGVVVLLLLVGIVVRAMLHSGRAQDAQNPVVVVSPETTTPRKPPPAVPPVAAKPRAAAPNPVVSAATPAAAPSTSLAGTWRVVAFTYNFQGQAEHKAHTINEKHPDLEASVFSPKGSGAPYLVTLGSATDRASAFRLRDKAVGEGLPRDTYAQNYSH
ncbi:hypothetical protein H7849_23335 [Alloacidobacterium dinghuense]|uniref:SPOR domain-containing protein n=1 Tax=Alloacidobacterium dinghuense TaxID=2763107 RepID=A0A7G8BHA4_9BACT|nr:hypothetical protein [Alloacidobacterium dinghuense]QNI31924.1 hypothetical protein H7849_23335 [Alloacidobacterium dinghuense]